MASFLNVASIKNIQARGIPRESNSLWSGWDMCTAGMKALADAAGLWVLGWTTDPPSSYPPHRFLGNLAICLLFSKQYGNNKSNQSSHIQLQKLFKKPLDSWRWHFFLNTSHEGLWLSRTRVDVLIYMLKCRFSQNTTLVKYKWTVRTLCFPTGQKKDNYIQSNEHWLACQICSHRPFSHCQTELRTPLMRALSGVCERITTAAFRGV